LRLDQPWTIAGEIIGSLLMNGYVATDATLIRYQKEDSVGVKWQSTEFDDTSWDTVKVSFGPQFWRLGPLPAVKDSQLLVTKLSAVTMIDPTVPVTN
jgi:hypothetical protein